MGSFHIPANVPTSSALPETSCAYYLLQELKLIWDEVGQDQLERERVLLELEQECLEIYRRKVDSANISRVRLHQSLADSEAELTNLLLSLGERSFPGRPEKLTGSLQEQLDSITPALREMQMRKGERVKQFQEVQSQIQRISSEITGQSENGNVVVNESDLSLKKLEEYQNELHRLHKEKNGRLKKAEEYISAVHELSATMGMDSSKIIMDVHPSLVGTREEQKKNISDHILDRLNSTVELLKDEKEKRMEKLHRLEKALTNLWNLMDTPFKDRQSFRHMAIISGSENCISSPGSLTLDIIHLVESEVERLDQLKASKMKELFIKKQVELEEICNKSHMEIPSKTEMDNIMALIMSGRMDHTDLLVTMEEYISKANEEASSRKDIMEKVDKWMASCVEEHWLEEYNRDQNRYSVSRGAHKNLMRAERARLTVNKISVLMELLMIKTNIWEKERKKNFLYDKVPLLEMLEEYTLLRHEKEEEKYRERERKKGQGQIATEQERYFGSRPSTSARPPSNRNLNCSFISTASTNRRNSSMTQQLASNSSSVKEAKVYKEGKKLQMQKLLVNNRNSTQFKAYTVSDITAMFSGQSTP